MMKRVLRLAGMMLLLGAGCYETPKPSCAFRCGPGEACPDGYQCQPDKVCHLVRSGGRIAECDQPLPIDAGADAPIGSP